MTMKKSGVFIVSQLPIDIGISLNQLLKLDGF